MISNSSYIEISSFSVATSLFLILGLIMLTGKRDNLPKTMLALAALASAVWSASVTIQAIYGGLHSTTLLLELFRSLSWFTFLLVMLRTAYISSQQINKNFKIVFVGVSVFIVGLMFLAIYRISGGSLFGMIAGNDVLIGHLLISLGGIVIIEQLYQNTSVEHRSALKYLWIAIGAMFTYDFYMYSDAFLFQRIDKELWDARGFIHAMVVPLIGVAIKRDMRWSLADNTIDIFISRRIVFHTTTLLAAGIYLIFIGFGGYYVRDMGGDWGVVAQATFIFAAVLILTVLLFSGKIRSRLKVSIDKHFFHYKYDYREEWLRIIRTLSSSDGEKRLHERAIKSLAQIIDSPGGVLFIENDKGYFEFDERWNYEQLPVKEPVESSFIKFLSGQQFVICLDEYYADPDMYTRLAPLEIPDWLSSNKNAWLVVPLITQDHMMGFIVLLRSPAHQRYFNWEDSDLLKTAGKQAASHLSQYYTAQALVNAKRFEEVNQLSAFIVHDIKNMVGQLSMVVSNASKHKNNPMFIDDAIVTVENSVSKMNKLLKRLRGGGDSDKHDSIDLCELLNESIKSCMSTGVLPVPVLKCKNDNVCILADKDRMLVNMAHIIQNSQDATSDEGSITVTLSIRDQCAVIEITDTGEGMSENFIRNQLFQPFESTKGTMGIGVFQVREYVYKLGGQMDVESEVDRGTTFRLIIPIEENQANDGVVINLSEHDKFTVDM